jgi:hypothetical protein
MPANAGIQSLAILDSRLREDENKAKAPRAAHVGGRSYFRST